MLREGDTLVPLIFMSNGTYLSNFAGDKKEWPEYMTIGNLSSKIRQMPSTHSVVMVAFLLIPIKNRNIPQKRLDKQRQTNREVVNEVLRPLLQPLTYQRNPSARSRYYNVLCADGNFRCCKPVLVASLAECPEYRNLHHLKRHACFRCECPKNKLGDYVHPDKQHPRQDHNLPKPDLLHTMQIGMMDHLEKWIFHFMKTHERLDKYNATWLSVPAYHDLTPKNKSYEEVSQWNGKEMKEMSRYLLGVVTQSLVCLFVLIILHSAAKRPWHNATVFPSAPLPRKWKL